MELTVAPLAGAWIETTDTDVLLLTDVVAPLAGAWIETFYLRDVLNPILWSPPSRGRGLKQHVKWISILMLCRPPRGGVD